MAQSLPLPAQSRRGIYLPLSDPDEIRLLVLQPRNGGEAVACNFKHVKKSRKPQYEALSYIWGSNDIMNIQINGHDAEVRQNLWQALYHLRYDNAPRILWVDAISINQQDVHERNHQVEMMGKIYAGASRVVVWLGEPTPPIIQAMEFLARTKPGDVVTKLQAGNRNFDYQFYRISRNGRFSTVKSAEINTLLLHQYWDRLWIIQEVLLASEVIVYSGTRSVPLSHVWDFFRNF